MGEVFEARAELTNPGDTNVTLTITMPLRRWKELHDQLSSAFPSWKLSEYISQVTNKATTHFGEVWVVSEE